MNEEFKSSLVDKKLTAPESFNLEEGDDKGLKGLMAYLAERLPLKYAGIRHTKKYRKHVPLPDAVIQKRLKKKKSKRRMVSKSRSINKAKAKIKKLSR